MRIWPLLSGVSGYDRAIARSTRRRSVTLRLTHKLLAGAVTLACAGLAQAATLTISCGTVGQDYDSCKRLTDEWARKTGNTVQLLSIPNSSTEILDLYKKMFASHAADVDVVIVDAVWPARSANTCWT